MEIIFLSFKMEERKRVIRNLIQVSSIVIKYDYYFFGNLINKSEERECSATIILKDDRLAIALYSGRINIWNLKNMKVDLTLDEHSDYPYDLAVLSDGRLVSIDESMIKIWDLTSNRSSQTLELIGITAVAILPDDRIVIGADRQIFIWDLNTLEIIFQEEDVIDDIIILPNDKIVFCSDIYLTIWDLNKRQIIKRFNPLISEFRGMSEYKFDKIIVKSSRSIITLNNDGSLERKLEGYSIINFLVRNDTIISNIGRSILIWENNIRKIEIGSRIDLLSLLPDDSIICGTTYGVISIADDYKSSREILSIDSILNIYTLSNRQIVIINISPGNNERIDISLYE